MPRRVDTTDLYTEGYHVRLTFGEHIECPNCRGMGIDVPMSIQEHRQRQKARGKGQPLPPRWACDRCGGSRIIGLND